jgi:D-alanine transaminase
VTAHGVLTTHNLDSHVLPGITRATVNDVASSERLTVEERPFRLTEALAAREAFLTSATNTVMPIISIDGKPIGDGRPGPIVQRLRSRFHQVAEISIV